MDEIRTSKLEKALSSPYSDLDTFFVDNTSGLITEERPFTTYMRSLFVKHNTRPKLVFDRADIPLRYGYRIISGEKHTKQRDFILRICYSADFTLEETQRALQIYGMNRLYARYPRDAVLIYAFEHGITDISKVNEMLASRDMTTLSELGVTE